MPRSADLKPVHVVAGVLRDTRGRILLARRTEGRDLAGAWEFPGGKVEANETAAQALARELFEELGVRIGDIEPLISVPQRYSNKNIVLDVYTVSSFTGKAIGCEKQALAWSPREKLVSYPMPAADIPVVAALNMPSVLAITPEFTGDKSSFLQTIEKQLNSGIRLLQLRVASLNVQAFKELAMDVRTLCNQYDGAQLFINGDIAVARALDCAVHLKSEQLMHADIAEQLNDHPFSAACHDLSQLKRAEKLKAQFSVLSPIQKTASHPEASGIGWKRFAELRSEVSLPIFAMGGLGKKDIVIARQHGAQGVAGISQFWV